MTGAISLRTKGVYFIMITLAFGQMLFFLATSLAAYGGDDGMTLAARSRCSAAALAEERRRASTTSCFGCLLGAYLLLARASSPRASAACCAASRENPVRMEAIGFAPYPLPARRLCHRRHDRRASPAACSPTRPSSSAPPIMTWQRSGELIFMVVLGGLGTLHGAILGAAGVPACSRRSLLAI